MEKLRSEKNVELWWENYGSKNSTAGRKVALGNWHQNVVVNWFRGIEKKSITTFKSEKIGGLFHSPQKMALSKPKTEHGQRLGLH